MSKALKGKKKSPSMREKLRAYRLVNPHSNRKVKKD